MYTKLLLLFCLLVILNFSITEFIYFIIFRLHLLNKLSYLERARKIKRSKKYKIKVKQAKRKIK